MTTLDWARRYVKLGWSVIPVKNKIPQLSSWSEYQTRLPTELELQKWFLTPQHGIGIVTGPLSNLCVIDADTPQAYESLRSRGITSPVSVKTPKGHHLYFKYQEGVRNHVRILENVDIRSEGGFVVAPDTNGYRFNNAFFTVQHIPKFPDNFVPKTQEVKRNGEGWIAAALSNLQEGNRDSTFTSIIGRLNRDGYSAPDIVLLLAAHAETSGFGVAALEEKIQHILRSYPHAKNNEISNGDSDSLNDFLADVQPLEWLCEPVIAKGTLCFMAGLPKTSKTWLCADLAIEVARGGMWLGRYPVAKNKVMFIDQERWRGEVQRRFKSLISDKGIDKKDLEDTLVLKSQTTTRLNLDESFNAFRHKLEDVKPALVIIDSFATISTINENDRVSLQAVLERFKQLRSEFGCTFLIIDHEGKSVLNPEDRGAAPTAFTIVGSVGKPAAAESVLTVRQVGEGESIVYHTASNLGPTIEPVKVSVKNTSAGVHLFYS